MLLDTMTTFAKLLWILQCLSERFSLHYVSELSTKGF